MAVNEALSEVHIDMHVAVISDWYDVQNRVVRILYVLLRNTPASFLIYLFNSHSNFLYG